MTGHLTEEMIADLKDAFKHFDNNGVGSILSKDLRSVMRSLGQSLTDAELTEFINEADTAGRGIIDFPEFLSVMSKKLCAGCEACEDDTKNLIAKFKFFDKNDSGLISTADFRHVLENCGEDLSVEEVDELFSEGCSMEPIDSINYEEFVKMLMAK